MLLVRSFLWLTLLDDALEFSVYIGPILFYLFEFFRLECLQDLCDLRGEGWNLAVPWTLSIFTNVFIFMIKFVLPLSFS